jgi:hypothetical protein
MTPDQFTIFMRGLGLIFMAVCYCCLLLLGVIIVLLVRK